MPTLIAEGHLLSLPIHKLILPRNNYTHTHTPPETMFNLGFVVKLKYKIDHHRQYSVITVVQLLSRVQHFTTWTACCKDSMDFTWTAACQASLSFTISQVCSNSCPLSQWWHPTVCPLLSPSPPAFFFNFILFLDFT